MDALTINNLEFTYRQNGHNGVLYANFSVSFEKNRVTALMGPSGCGKSTLGKLAGGVLRPQDGSIVWHNDFEEEKHRYYIDQDPARVIFPHQNARMNVMYPLEKLCVPAAEAKERTNRTLNDFGLYEKAEEYPRDLSGGEKSRLALARVLSWKPKAVILDECLNGLDMNTREIILGILERRADAGNSTTIFITHTLHEVLRIANRCVILGNHPVSIRDDIDIPLAYPRDENSQEYLSLQNRLISLLRDEI